VVRQKVETSFSTLSEKQVILPGHIIDLAADELRSATGEQVMLRPRTMAVLRLLTENAGHLVRKEDINASVWADVFVTDDSLTQCIAEIRRAIGDKDHRVLRTVPRRGYLLVPAQRTSLSTSAGSPVIAVMPFTSLSREKGQSLAVGVATEIVNELARNRDLKIIGRESSFALSGLGATARELGQRLGARYLVEGTVQRSKNTLVVDLQLVDTRDGIIAWGDRFTATAADIPKMQRQIVERIAASLRVSMRETEKHAVVGRAPQDLGVYELTLCGASKHRFTPEATRAARMDYEEALRRDPNYAPAWSLLAWTNMIDIWAELTGEWHLSRIDEVVDQFRRAIELDPTHPKAYYGLSQALITNGDVAQALTLSARAVELAPSNPDSLLFHGMALFESGDVAAAAATTDTAMELHPLPPSYYHLYRAMVLWGNRRFQEALGEADECLRKAPNLRGAEIYRALALVNLGRTAEAKIQLAQNLSRYSRPLTPPHPPELASRFLADLNAAGWRPSIATEREAV
jgi:TolB-like protein/Tfp pilus assembly protein PilF